MTGFFDQTGGFLNRAIDVYKYEGIIPLLLRTSTRALSELFIQFESHDPLNHYNFRKKAVELNVSSSKFQSKYHIKSLISRNIGTEFNFEAIKQNKNSDTVFVLGSGESINNISKKEWEQIREQDSIGLNRWPVHDHVPTFYVYETPRDQYILEKLYELLEYKEDAYQNVPTIIKDVNRTKKILNSANMPEWIGEEAYLSKDMALPDLPNTEETYDEIMKFLIRNDYYAVGTEPEMYYHNRGSISHIIHLLISLNYENIVLCGVDMINSRYFFDDKKYKDSDTPIPIHNSAQREGVHKTIDKNIAEVTLKDVIYTLNETVLKKEGIDLYVENTISALHPKIPRWIW